VKGTPAFEKGWIHRIAKGRAQDVVKNITQAQIVSGNQARVGVKAFSFFKGRKGSKKKKGEGG